MLSKIETLLSYHDNFAAQADIQSQLIMGDEDYCRNLKPQFSIFIPTYKRIDYLQEALDSAISQQDADSYEIIIVDNENDPHSKTAGMLQNYQHIKNLRYYHNSANLGMYGNWNRGIQLSYGQWVVMLHDDDYLRPQFLKEIAKVIAHKNDINLLGVYTDRYQIGYQRSLKSGLNYFLKVLLYGWRKLIPITLEDAFVSSPVHVTGYTIRKEVAIALGGFGLTSQSEDTIFTIKVLLHYQGVYNLPKRLGVYRWGVNASLSESAQIEFVCNNYWLRQALLKHLFANKKLFELCNRMQTRAALQNLPPSTYQKIQNQIADMNLEINHWNKILYCLGLPYFHYKRLNFISKKIR